MDDVTSLVIQTLHNKLPDIPVYRENMRTAFSEPSFFVSRISSTQQGETFGFAMRMYAFDVAYFPNPKRPNEDMDNMAEWLMANLKVIEPNYAHVINQAINVTDGVLHYTFNARARVHEDYEDRFTEPLNYKGELKHGQDNPNG